MVLAFWNGLQHGILYQEFGFYDLDFEQARALLDYLE